MTNKIKIWSVVMANRYEKGILKEHFDKRHLSTLPLMVSYKDYLHLEHENTRLKESFKKQWIKSIK